MQLIKGSDNKHDVEAVSVGMEVHGKVGYVANSTHTVWGKIKSAGRIYKSIIK